MAGTFRNNIPSHEQAEGQQLLGVYHDAEPYRRLWAAKMLIMVSDYTTHLRAVRSKISRESKMKAATQGVKAGQWIYSEDDGVGSFIWTCNVLGLDPKRVRMSVERNWRKIKGGANNVRTVRKSEGDLP